MFDHIWGVAMMEAECEKVENFLEKNLGVTGGGITHAKAKFKL